MCIQRPPSLRGVGSSDTSNARQSVDGEIARPAVTSGPNSGRLAEVMLHEIASGVVTITLLEAPVRAVAGGNAFTIRAGCDKRSATCAAKFSNIANFRGFPHIPGQDAVVRYATADGGHEGALL